MERLTYTVPEAAAALGICDKHAYEMIRQHQLPSIRLGRKVLVPVKKLEEFIMRGDNNVQTG